MFKSSARKSVFIALAHLFLAAFAFGGSADYWKSYDVPAGQTVRRVSLHLPADYDVVAKSPVTYLIGKKGENTSDLMLRLRVVSEINGSSSASKRIYVETGISDPTQEELDFLTADLIPWVQSNFNVDENSPLLMEPIPVAGQSVSFSELAKSAYPDRFVALLYPDTPPTQSLSGGQKALFWASAGALAGAEACDSISSQPKLINGQVLTGEANGLLATNGQFELKGDLIKFGLTAGIIGGELLLKHFMRHDSIRSQRWDNIIFSTTNLLGAAVTFAVCKRNVDINNSLREETTPAGD